MEKMKLKFLCVNFLFICSAAKANSYFYSSSELVVKKSADYFYALSDCLVSESEKQYCTYDNYVHDPQYRKEVIKFADRMKIEYERVFEKKYIPDESKTPILIKEKEFIDSTLSFQFKVLDFVSFHQHRCIKSSETGAAIKKLRDSLLEMSTYFGYEKTENQSDLDILFSGYAPNNFCSDYKQINQDIINHAFGGEFKDFEKKYKLRTVMSHFLLNFTNYLDPSSKKAGPPNNG